MPPKNMKRGGNKHGKKSGGVKKGSIGSGGSKKPNLKKKSKLVVTFDPEKRMYAFACMIRGCNTFLSRIWLTVCAMHCLAEST